jgi:hypothetical protein
MLLALGACVSEPPIDDDFGIDEDIVPAPALTKEDGAGRAGPRVANNTSATQVWYARNNWEDRTTAEAKKAGLAWGENSGLNWDEKYARWIESLEEVTGAEGYHTFKLTTPWGKTVAAPVLECAEAGIFLRATFAAWYKLPFFLEAVAGGQRVYFGHFGIRTGTARYANTPNFAQVYKDHSELTPAELERQGWPSDAKLRARAAAGGADLQVEPAGQRFGAYLDEVHLNKRAGHLIIYLVNYFGSANLAAGVNTFNLTPESIRSGDLLLHRWQRNGIGDAKIVKRVGENASGKMVAQLMSGSMPRRQPKVYDELASKGYFTSEDTGGPGTNPEGDKYFKLGGGVKRWRVTKNIGGYWTNTWMAADEASWINDQDEARITARPAQFQALLGEVPPAEKKAALLRQIDDARQHLRRYPASCAARQRRERAFRDLLDLAPSLGTSRAALEREHRKLEDFVFAELSYAQSKTCCWNSSTANMAEIILDYAEKEQEAQCVQPTVFRSRADGYQLWAQHAASLGRGAEWEAFREDEACAQRNVAEDTVLPSSNPAWCSIAGGGGGGACSDALEPNNARGAARTLAPGTYEARICPGDHDWFRVVVPAGRSLDVRVVFTHHDGDLDAELTRVDGTRVMASEGTSDEERLSAAGGAEYLVHVFGYAGAVNGYRLTISY